MLVQRHLIAISAILAATGCKQVGGMRAQAPTNEIRTDNSEFRLVAPTETTGKIALVPLQDSNSAHLSQLGLIECNSADLAEANAALHQLHLHGARLDPNERTVSPTSGPLTPSVACHLLHRHARADSLSVTLVNERLRSMSGLREPSRSDLAIYELAQLLWVGMSIAARHHPTGFELSIDPRSSAEGDLGSRAERVSATHSRLNMTASTYDPCSEVAPTSPRWLSDAPKIRLRLFECIDGVAQLRIDQNRTYTAVRHSLRSAIVALYQDSRGMRPILGDGPSINRFAISPHLHSLTP